MLFFTYHWTSYQFLLVAWAWALWSHAPFRISHMIVVCNKKDIQWYQYNVNDTSDVPEAHAITTFVYSYMVP